MVFVAAVFVPCRLGNCKFVVLLGTFLAFWEWDERPTNSKNYTKYRFLCGLFNICLILFWKSRFFKENDAAFAGLSNPVLSMEFATFCSMMIFVCVKKRRHVRRRALMFMKKYTKHFTTCKKFLFLKLVLLSLWGKPKYITHWSHLKFKYL